MRYLLLLLPSLAVGAPLTQQSNPTGLTVNPLPTGSTIAANGSISISSAASASVTVVPNFFINNGNGNVGIKTASPLFDLDVNGQLRASNATSLQSVTMSSGTSTGAFRASGVMHVGGATNLLGSLTVNGSSATVLGAIGATGRTNFSGVFFASTSINDVTFGSQPSYPCITSTITWVSNGNLALVSFDGYGYNTSATGAEVLLRIGINGNGADVCGANSTVPLLTDSADTIYHNFNFTCYMRKAAGTYSLCMTASNSQNTQHMTGSLNIMEF